jgi:hypothetical protein
MEEKIFQLFPKSVIPGDKNSTFPILQVVKQSYQVVPNLFWLSSEAVLTSRSFLKGKANFY